MDEIESKIQILNNKSDPLLAAGGDWLDWKSLIKRFDAEADYKKDSASLDLHLGSCGERKSPLAPEDIQGTVLGTLTWMLFRQRTIDLKRIDEFTIKYGRRESFAYEKKRSNLKFMLNMRSREGNCVALSTAFIALARRQGIPCMPFDVLENTETGYKYRAQESATHPPGLGHVCAVIDIAGTKITVDPSAACGAQAMAPCRRQSASAKDVFNMPYRGSIRPDSFLFSSAHSNNAFLNMQELNNEMKKEGNKKDSNKISAWKEVIEYFLREAVVAYKMPDNLNSLAEFLIQTNRPQEAIKYLREAIQIEPKNYKYWRHLGWAYEKMEMFQNARNCYTKSLEYCKEPVEKKKISGIIGKLPE